MLESNQVSIIFQGGVNTRHLGTNRDDGSDFLYNVARTKAAYPHAKIILSTWQNVALPADLATAEQLGIDAIVRSPDPGGLPNIKFGYHAPNNVNRQIVSTAAGLQAVTTPYAIKLRTDSYLTCDHLLGYYQDYQQRVLASHLASQTLANPQHASTPIHASPTPPYEPIVVPHLFTIDPNVYEHMAYHVSDWAQFATTAALQAYWSVPLMREADARYFEYHAHDIEASYGNDAFRTRLAVEQHIATHYAHAQGFVTPAYYNQITPRILQAHQDFLARHVIVLDTAEFGLALPKYGWAYSDEFMRLNCISHDDWYQIFCDYWQLPNPDTARLTHAQARARQKRAARVAFEREHPPKRHNVLARLYP